MKGSVQSTSTYEQQHAGDGLAIIRRDCSAGQLTMSAAITLL